MTEPLTTLEQRLALQFLADRERRRMTEPKPTEAEVAIGRAIAAQAPFTVPDAQEMHAFAIASALAEARAAARSPAPEWRPISEYDASEHGEIVDAWATRRPEMDEGFQRYPAARKRGNVGWTNHDGTTPIYPTHFTPLPSPPKETNGG